MHQSNHCINYSTFGKTEISNLVFNKAPLKQDTNVPTSGKPRYAFELWCLEKVDNKLEHNMVKHDDKT
jgi:hypothetical protein